MIVAVDPAPVVIRTGRPDDQAFVAATLAEQLQRGHHAGANSIVDRIFDSPRVAVLIAERDNRIIGWLAYARIPRVRAVLFLYTRRADRTAGIARALTDSAFPTGRGQWVHAGLRGSSTKSVLQRFPAVEMTLGELL